MPVQTQQRPTKPGPDIDAGVIEDARARQRRHRRGGAAAILAATALVAGLIFGFGGGGSGGGPGSGRHSSSPGAPRHGNGIGRHQADSAVLGAPKAQPGKYLVSGFVCALAPANRYLPRRSGCVSVYPADVDGATDNTTGLVLLYATLGSRSVDGDYRPLSWTLEMVAGSGEIARAKIAPGDIIPFILRIGNVNALPGDEVIVQPDSISSGSYVTMYSLNAGSLRAVGTFSAGGDSLDQSSFMCKQSPAPEVVQDVGTTDARNIFTGTWKWTAITYVWHAATLKRGPSRTFERKGIPSVTAPKQAWGAGCGTLTGKAGDQ